MEKISSDRRCWENNQHLMNLGEEATREKTRCSRFANFASGEHTACAIDQLRRSEAYSRSS